jgi:6-phosphogluconolactonase
VASFLTAGDPAGTAARLLAQQLEEADRLRGRARLAVAGGSALGVLGALRGLVQGGVWSRLALTWVDERCVPLADPQSNRGSAYRGGQLDAADPPALELPLYLDGETPPEACARVAAALRGDFQGGLDALLLGMGEDGHIASLFPGRPFERIGNPPVFPVPDSPKPPPRRITLALSMLATAGGAVLVAPGDAKREARERLAQGDPELPASTLKGLTVIS